MSDSTSNTRAFDLSYLKKQEEETILRDNYLFVIGINEYQHCTPLSNAVNDAESFAKILNEKYRFKHTHTYRLIDGEATIDKIDDTFKEIKSKVRDGQDNLIVFFCGHGFFDEEWNTAYWVPVEARADRAIGEYFSHEDLMKRINAIKTHHTVVIADSCYSGAAFVSQKRSHDPNSQIFAKEPSRWMLASGRNEPVNDGSINENSPFTAELLDILKRESSTGIRMGTLVEKLKTRVNNNTDQTPIGQPLRDVGDKGGEFIFFPKDNEEDRWKEVRKKETLEALEQFTNDFPGGKFHQEALDLMAKIKAKDLYAKIIISPTEELCQEYIDQYPEGEDLIEVSKIKFALSENRIWEEARESNRLEDFDNYLKKYPNGKYIQEASEKKKEQERGLKAWKEAEALAKIPAYERFITEYPESEFFDEATEKLMELKAWTKVVGSKKATQLEAFIKEFPQSSHLEEAKDLLADTQEKKFERRKLTMYIGIAAGLAILLGVVAAVKHWNDKMDIRENYGMAKGFIAQGKFYHATVSLEKLAVQDPQNKKVKVLLKLSLGAANLNKDLLNVNKAIESKRFEDAIKYMRGAIAHLEEGILDFKEVSDTLIRISFIESFELVRLDSFKQALTTIQNNFKKYKLEVYLGGIIRKGDKYFTAGNYKDAHKTYTSALKLDSLDVLKDENNFARRVQLSSLKGRLQEMILVPGGTQGGQAIDSFYISKYEVTNEEFVTFLNDQREHPDLEKWINIEDSDIDLRGNSYRISTYYKRFPVVGVSWYGAKAYADWSNSYLPSELEWEYAARAAGQDTFAYSGHSDASKVAYVFWKKTKKNAQRVGKKRANSLKIHDMSGNVWEWVSDTTGSDRIIKGGSFNRGKEYARIDKNKIISPNDTGSPKPSGGSYTNDLGFRIIRRMN